MIIFNWLGSQSPTVCRLSSYFGPEICECRQRQISQLNHGRLWVTRESSFHLPDQQFFETILQDVIIISPPHLYMLPRWVGFRKWTEVGHVALHHFPGFFYSKKRDDRDLPSFNIHHPDDLVRRFAFDGPPSCVWHSGNNRERASRHSDWCYGLAHSRARRWSSVFLWSLKEPFWRETKETQWVLLTFSSRSF